MARKATEKEQEVIDRAQLILNEVKLTITQLTDGNDTVTPRNTP